MSGRSMILSVPMLLLLLVHTLPLASADTIPLAAVTGYRLPGIFALNDGKPFYLDRDPVTGAVTFNPSGGASTQAVPSEPMAAESSPVADAATAADEYEEDEEDDGDHRPAPAAVADRGRPAGPLKAAPVVEEVEEDGPPPPRAAPLSKDEIDRKDTVSSSKGSSGGRPNEIQDGGNPYFQQFLNLNVHEYGDRIPGASNIRDEPYSFGGLGIGSSPLEKEYKFPLISSSYASTKVQGAGGNYFYGPKGADKEKNKEKDKYRPAYADHYTPSSTKKPTPSYYHESGNDDDDHYYGRPSSSSSSSASNPEEEEEEEDYHKFAGSSHQGNRGESEEGADEGEEEGDESIDDLVEEVADYNRPPVHPKRPEAPPRQPPKESSPTTHHHHYQGDEADEEASQDYDEEKPSYYGGGGGFGGRPAADKQRPQQTYYYGQPSDEEEEEEEQGDVPQRKPTRVQGADQGEEDRPKPSQASEEEAGEEGGEEGESTVKEKPQKLPPKPSLSYLGFSSDFEKDHEAIFGEKLQGSQKVERPSNEGPGYNYGYSGPPQNFGIGGFYSSDFEGPQRKPAPEPETVHSESEDEKPQPSNKKEEGAEEEEEDEEEEVVRKPYDNRRPYNPPQVVRFTPAQSSQAPTERVPAQQSTQTTPKPTTTTKQGTYYKPSYQSPYGIEEPFRPIYGPGEYDEPIRPRPGQNYQQSSNNRQEIQQPVRPSSIPPNRSTPSPDTRPSGIPQYDSYFPVRTQNLNTLPPNKKDNLPDTTRKDPISSTYKPYYESKTKKPIEQGPPSWKVYPSSNENGSQPSRPNQDESKESPVLREQVKPTTSNQEIITKRPATLPPPPPPHREIIGIGSVGEPEFVQPANNKPSYGPFRFPEQDYAPRPILPPQNGLAFAQRPSNINPVTAKPSLPPPPFGFPPQGPQRPILPPSQNIRPQLSETHPPQYLPQRPPALGGGPPPPPRRWEDRPVHPHPSARPPSQNFLHRPPPSRMQDQPLNAPPPTGGHPYKFVSRKPSQEPVLMGSAPNAVFGNAFNPNSKKSPPPNGPKAQVPDPNLPNILPQFRPNAKISYSTIHRENRPFGIPPPPPPPQYGPNQRISNIPERRIISPFYDHLQPPPPPPNRLQRIHGPEHEIPYGPPQVYPFGPGGSPPVGRRSGQHHQARVGEDSSDSSSESEEDVRKRPQVTTLQMMRNGLMEHQAARHPIVSKEDTGPKSTATPTTATVQLKPTVYITPDDGATGASLSVDSSASEEHPVFVVYPVSSDPSTREDGVVVGTRGSQRPLPPSSFAEKSEVSVLPQRPNSVHSDFPYPLLKPSSTLPTKPSKTDSEIVGPIYSSVAEEGPSDRIKENTESNIIPYLQDYSPYATRKPAVAPNEPSSTSAATEPSPVTTSSPSSTTTTSSTEKPSTKAPVTIVNAWQPDSEVEVSATMHTGHSGVPVNHRPLVEEKTEVSSPSPLNFQAPFHASENIDPAPDSGWSAVGGTPSTDFPTGSSSSISRGDYNIGTNVKPNDGDNGDNSKFDFDNFKPQLFGGFKPIFTHSAEGDDAFKYALGTTERQER
ncbi:trithorax group protein osa-like [Ischnura elegans]|uniref:trithorax group protein osa-like n=1 Tax=Ischnura elegans TaxID=197161 RepID=UPI001ED88A1D|nr:trithorax group protein osa-like [Ischnura elegans]